MYLNRFGTVIIIFMSLLTGCVSALKFQKNTGGIGYTIEDLDVKNSFKILVSLPSSQVTDKYLQKYAFRAAGEECLARGFAYFDFSYRDGDFYGFCYPTKTSKSLAITFVDSGLDKNPKSFIIESLNSKTSTNLKIGDEVLAFDDKPITGMWQVKYFVFEAADKKRNSMQLKIKRNQKELTVVEPLAEFSGYVYTDENLQALRKSVN